MLVGLGTGDERVGVSAAVHIHDQGRRPQSVLDRLTLAGSGTVEEDNADRVTGEGQRGDAGGVHQVRAATQQPLSAVCPFLLRTLEAWTCNPAPRDSHSEE